LGGMPGDGVKEKRMDQACTLRREVTAR
jgi:hypothetical protein